MLLKYYCSACQHMHIQNFKQGQYMLQGAHEIDCPYTGREVCEELVIATDTEYEVYQSLLLEKEAIMKKLESI